MSESESSAQEREEASLRIQSGLDHEEVCTHFETSWNSEAVDRIPDLVEHEDETQRSRLVCELVAIDVEMRMAQGKQVQQDYYLDRLPGFHAEVSDAFELLASQDDAEADQETSRMPAKVGDYRIIKRIGRGGSAVVYEAIQESLDRRVAIKMLNNPDVTSQLARFELESKLVARLHHTNIIEVYGSGIHEGTPYYAMQLVEGKTLREIIRETCLAQQSSTANSANGNVDGAPGHLVGIPNQKLVATIGLQVARAIDHAHQTGILHRDIKPANLLMDENGETWVGDFGIARLLNHDSPQTIAGCVVGTIRYLPPEAFSGNWHVQSDIYSLGTTLYELLALTPAFPAHEHGHLVSQITQGDQVKPLRQIDGSISGDLETIVAKAMSFEPQRRFSSAGEFADELQRYLRNEPIVSRQIPAAERIWRWAKRKPSVAALVALTFAVAFIGLPIAIWLWLRASQALNVAERQRAQAKAARYSNGVLLAQSYLQDSRMSDVERTLNELESNNLVGEARSGTDSPWEIGYLKQACDTATLTLQGDPELGVWHIALSPDEKQLATVHNGETQTHQSGEVVLWNLDTWEKERTLRDHGSRVFGCAYSSDGKRLATIGMNYPPTDPDSEKRGTLCVWDTSTGERTHQINLSGTYDELMLGFYGPPIFPGVVFSKDDAHLVTWPGPIEVFDAQSLKPKWKVAGRHAAQLPSGHLIVYEGNEVELHEIHTGKSLEKVGSQWGNYGPFSFDGQKMICRTSNGVRIWDSTESLANSQNMMWPDVSWAGVVPDKSRIVYGGGNGELIFSSFEPSPIDDSDVLVGHRSRVTSGAFFRDGSRLITGSVDGTSKVWDLASGSAFNTALRHDRIVAFGFDENSEGVLFAARNHDSIHRAYNAGAGKTSDAEPTTQKIECTYMAHWPRSDFSFAPTGKYLAAPAAERSRPDNIRGFAKHGRVNVWSTSEWDLLHTIDSQLEEIHATEWSPCEHLLFVAGQKDKRLQVLTYMIDEEATLLHEASKFGEASQITSLAFNGEHLAVGLQTEAQVWTVSHQGEGQTSQFNMSRVASFDGFENVVAVDFSPDGKLLATADLGDNNLRIFDIEASELRYQRPGPRSFCSVRFSPCGSRLALSGYDGVVHFCDTEYGNLILALSSTASEAGTVSINSKVIFSADGSKIATNNWLGEIAVWQVDKELNKNEME